MKIGKDFVGVAIVFLCHDGQGNYLFAKRSKHCRDEQGAWDCGGGALDHGEKIEDSLIREIKEEYCTDVLNIEFLGYRDVHRTNDNLKTHWLALDFKVLVNKEKVKIGEPHKFDDIGWFSLDDLPTPMHSQLHNTLKAAKSKK